MTHKLTNNYAKNYCNRTLIVKVIIENVVTCFLGTQCSNKQCCCTGTGTGTCEKVLVAKIKSFSALIDTLWHLYSETLNVWTTGFYVQVSLFGTIWWICIS